jgi:hypothetical protein
MEEGLVVGIDKSTIKDIDYIINTIVSKYASEVTDVAALAWTLQTLMSAKDELEKQMKEENNE